MECASNGKLLDEVEGRNDNKRKKKKNTRESMGMGMGCKQYANCNLQMMCKYYTPATTLDAGIPGTAVEIRCERSKFSL